ncbi:ATP phosphoribosyltransferase [Trichinella spiralis]|uniref:ATP phosphoribosyltransferase n=1 Tax=Trichinella spiralis TaxID=6334 RepID=A0ABR3KZ15_TRISP
MWFEEISKAMGECREGKLANGSVTSEQSFKSWADCALSMQYMLGRVLLRTLPIVTVCRINPSSSDQAS